MVLAATKELAQYAGRVGERGSAVWSGAEDKAHGGMARKEALGTSFGPRNSARTCQIAANPKGTAGHYRQVAAFLYEVAAEMELRSQEIDAKWVVSPEAYNDRIILELADGDDPERARADEFIAKLLSDRNLD